MGRSVKTYKILVHDRRCREPIVLTAEMKRDSRACEYARDQLASSPNYDAIEVWQADLQLCRLARPAAPERAAA